MYLEKNACHFVTNLSINTKLAPMERGTLRLPTVEFWSHPLQWAGHESTRKSFVLSGRTDFSASFRPKTYLQENACRFATNQSINTILVPMERGTFKLPTVEFWSRPLQWVGHESTRKSGELNSDSNSIFEKCHLASPKSGDKLTAVTGDKLLCTPPGLT